MRSRGQLPDRGTEIYIADTIGELGLVYRLAPIVFMGGSLVRRGGQNPIEAAKLGAAIVHGPHVWNFTEIYGALDDAHGAELIHDVHKLTVRFGAWLTDAAERSDVSEAALRTVELLGGALDRTLAALEPYLMQLGFINRTNRGRLATRSAYEHLGLMHLFRERNDSGNGNKDNGQANLF